MAMHGFLATIEILGVNPFVFVPAEILGDIFLQANKQSGPIPVRGSVNGLEYRQTLVKYAGEWRLYINLKMLKNSPKRIGESIEVTIEFDPETRSIAMHDTFRTALDSNQAAKSIFDSLSPSRQNEIVRYLASLKSAEAVEKNVKRAIDFLLGKGRFVGRAKP